jgi:predicted glycogen debranching enzyme
LPSITLDEQTLSSIAVALQKEWLITNGLGGYASSTVLGINTRKYHGLLVGAFHPPGDRRVCLEKLDEELSIGNETHLLGANEFQNGIHPQGSLWLKEFSLMPFPRFLYVVNDNVEVEKTVFMPFEKNAVVTLYRVLNKNSFGITIRVFPLVNWRPFHSVTDRWKNPSDFTTGHVDKEVEMRFGTPRATLIVTVVNGRFEPMGNWVEKVHYREEASRGESCFDDWYQPGHFEAAVKANMNESFAIIAVVDEDEGVTKRIADEIPDTVHDMEVLFKKEMELRENFLARFYGEHERITARNWLDWLVLATDSFTVRGSGTEKFVIAGYHWFEAWGRDTFISLPGLLLVTGRFEDARKVFLSFKDYFSEGLIPNLISNRREALAYNSVDATLWYMNAVLQYLKYTGDFKFVRDQLWETLKVTFEDHMKGTKFNIRVDSDGLLSHDAQLTWMDATVDGQPVTPRAGKAVEVQALWYNALRIMELLAERFDEKGEAKRYLAMAEETKKSFVEKFWDSRTGHLFDVISENSTDNSVRPNQIIAVALDFTMLDTARNEEVVDAVHRELLTPCGLRSLARNDSRYVGIYAGDRRSRDRAYHNGTVWSWLLGPFTTAFLNVKGRTEYQREYASKNFLEPLFAKQIFKAGLGTISEIFDGEPPHTPRGCIAQAWSVAELLRAYTEDVLQIRPRYEGQIGQQPE